jgi:biotin carboxyl carrier protein
MKYKIGIGDNKYEVEVGEINASVARVTVNGSPYEVLIENYDQLITSMGSLPQAPASADVAPPVAVRSSAPKASPGLQKSPSSSAAPAPTVAMEAGVVVAPIPGLILDVKVKVGDSVIAGQTLATMEAMKMENNIASRISGVVNEIRVQKGSEVATGDVIMVIG